MKSFICCALAVAGALHGKALYGQDEKRSRIDVDSYIIDAQVNPDTQTLTARVAVKFLPLDDRISSATFELNNNLNISKIVDDKGQSIQGAPACSSLSAMKRA